MSFNRSSSDIKAYKDTIRQSKEPGDYQLYKSPVLDKVCLPKTPTIRLQKNGVSINNRTNLTDIHSNLLGISVDKTNLGLGNAMCDNGYPCSGGLVAKCLNKVNSNDNTLNKNECFIPVESTRLSNPPCTLRGLENDRLDHNICLNPQKRILHLPFKNNISVRLTEKDKFVPCVYRLNEQSKE